MHKESITSVDDINIYTWTMGKKTSPALLIFHGALDHSGRYEEMAQFFSKEFFVLGFDLPGHGLSGGMRGHIERFQHFVKVSEDVYHHYQIKKFFCFAHSMGGLVAHQLFRRNSYPINKIFFHNPAFSLHPGWIERLSRAHFQRSILWKFLPTGVQLPYRFSPKILVRDLEAREKIERDHLTGRKMSIQFFLELLRAQEAVQKQGVAVKKEFFLYQAMKDALVNPQRNLELFEKAGYHPFRDEQGFHESHFDTHKQEVWEKARDYFLAN